MDSNKRQPSAFDKDLGRKIRMMRIMRDLTMVELSARLGISHQQLQKHEKGIDRITVERLVQIGQALRVPVTEFLKTDRLDAGINPEILRTAGVLHQLPSNDVRRDLQKLVRTICNSWSDDG
ncbi:helix-turn-helix domain-containing protein [Roseibium alexandrii]|uniref:helix-turn-helix domain-containing protein n=1 Tax=Roseibium alexandrii TaxID=388408 RepID=UPI00375301D9